MNARKRSGFCGTEKWSRSRPKRFTDWRPTRSIRMRSPKFSRQKNVRFDPLIVHLPSGEALDEIAIVESQVAHKLMEKFWPGPLTIIFIKREIVPNIVTAGLETVAVRMSAHPIFREVVRRLNRPLAAPSANRFGRISPTTAQHVRDELSGR